MRKGILLVALPVLLLAVPATASAGWQIQRASAIARVVWHHPCVDRMQVRWAPQPAEITHDALAWADPASCTVTLKASVHLEWGDVCYELLHEAGHLAGYWNPVGVTSFDDSSAPVDHDHSPRPGSIMYPSPSTINNDGHIPADANSRCRRNGRPFLEAHGLL